MSLGQKTVLRFIFIFFRIKILFVLVTNNSDKKSLIEHCFFSMRLYHILFLL